MTFSVLISVYKNDSAEQFHECLNSLAIQTLQANEIILIKDGPVSEEIDSVIKEFNNRIPLKVFGYDENHGLAYALNYGMKFCSGDLIARMDADDICYPDRFKKQIHEFENNPNLNILGTGIEEFYVSKNDKVIKNIRLYPKVTSRSSKTLYKGTPLAHPTVMMRSEVFKKYKYNLNNQKYSQDIELWFRLLLDGYEIQTIQEPLLHFRITDKTFLRRNISKAKTEFRIYISSLYKLNGFSILLIYPLFRFCSRLLPASIIKKIYFSNSRNKMFR